MKEIYRNYFQKSFNFLFPLLGFKRGDFHPINTYVNFADIYSEKDYKLICVYNKENNEKWKQFINNKLLLNPLLENIHTETDKVLIAIFDLYVFKNDYDFFLEGKYSKLSPESKKRIIDYFRINSKEWVYIDSFLFPEKYIKEYAEILNVPEDLLTELCDIYNKNLETFNLK